MYFGCGIVADPTFGAVCLSTVVLIDQQEKVGNYPQKPLYKSKQMYYNANTTEEVDIKSAIGSLIFGKELRCV